MKRKRLIAGIVTVAALAGGTAGAVAGTNDGKEAEQAVLSDAATRLGVSADELRSALRAAEDGQLDAAVRAGELTQEQADRMKEHRRARGTVLRLGHGGRHGGPGGRRGGGRQLMKAAAGALGISRGELLERLRSGETLTQIARAEGRTPAEVKSEVRNAATDRLDAALKAGRITEARHEAMVEHLAERIERLGERPFFLHRRGGARATPPAQDDGSTDEGAVRRAA